MDQNEKETALAGVTAITVAVIACVFFAIASSCSQKIATLNTQEELARQHIQEIKAMADLERAKAVVKTINAASEQNEAKCANTTR